MISESRTVTESDLDQLSQTAWLAREQAFVFGGTKVGASLLTADGSVFAGCNVEHRYRSHDVHAEVNAITTMVAAGHQRVVAILVAAERTRFTPCGACMDWIFQFGGPDCLVGYQSKAGGKINVLTATELMPFYPM